MKILIVEDSKFAQTVNARFFTEAFPGSEMILTDNGINGYNNYLQARPDFIVTDLLMPQMSGQDFIKKVRQVDQNIMIFIITADIQQSTKSELESYDIAAFINKPLDRDKMALVQQIVEERLHA